MLILDKPAGLPVHRGPRGGASIEDWLPALAMGKKRLPQPAHRLDTDTAGCLVLGRTKPMLAELGALFAAGRAEKTYWAVVRGAPPTPEGVVEAPLLKRSTAKEGWRLKPMRSESRWFSRLIVPSRTAVTGSPAGLSRISASPSMNRIWSASMIVSRQMLDAP